MPQNDDSIEIIQVRKLHPVSPELAFSLWEAVHFSCPMSYESLNSFSCNKCAHIIIF